jgi:hypothetical protein
MDATRTAAKKCMVMLMELAAEGDRPAMRRRVVFGPVAHFRQHAPEESSAGGSDRRGQGDREVKGTPEHPFCPCCLLTHSIEAFKPLIESRGAAAVCDPRTGSRIRRRLPRQW